jgi:hypothetical protein
MSLLNSLKSTAHPVKSPPLSLEKLRTRIQEWAAGNKLRLQSLFSDQSVNQMARDLGYDYRERVFNPVADRTQAIFAGGLCPILQMIKTLDLRQRINRCIPIFKVYAPYDEADHVLNIALNLLAGGTCLDHLEIRRTDEAYLNALGAQRIPDPTTAGDFCRRFDEMKILMLMQAINKSRLQVWTQQPAEFFERAIIEADGTMVETSGQRKEGIGMNYKKQWGYHPLVVTLANTQEVLYIHNRSGSRPSHENSGFFFDRSIELRRSEFK